MDLPNNLIPRRLNPTGSAVLRAAKPAPNCGKCEDSGYQGWKTPPHYPLSQCSVCDCEAGQYILAHWQRKEAEAHQRRLAKLFLAAGIPAHFRDFTLETMIERAGDDHDKLDAIALVRQFLDDGLVLDPYTNRYKPGIILSGNFGCGKTGLLTPVLRRLIEQGKSGLWVEVYDLISAIQQGYADGDSNEKLNAAQRSDVILLDDLGDVTRNREETEDRRRIIYQIINYRHNNALPMLITTNCDAMQLTLQFGARTVERIVESCVWMPMGGRNLRTEPRF